MIFENPQSMALLMGGLNLMQASQGGSTDLSKQGWGYGLSQGLKGALEGAQIGQGYKKQKEEDELKKTLAGSFSTIKDPQKKAVVTGLMNQGKYKDAYDIVQPQPGKPTSLYDNVTQDDNGQWWGLNKNSQQVEQIPMGSDSFTKYKTVQSTNSKGMPITELVSPALLNSQSNNARITVGQKNTLPTEGEAKSISQAELGVNIISRLKTQRSKKNSPTIGPTADLYRDAKTLPIIGSGLHMIGQGLSKDEASLMTDTTALSNILLAAMRGAQVGPEEQAKFEKQLPMPGQPDALFDSNLKATEQNLMFINQRKKELRGISFETQPISKHNLQLTLNH